MAHLYNRLKSLVSDNPDPFLYMHIVENLGKPIPPYSKYYPLFMKYRQELFQLMTANHWNPQRPLGPRQPNNQFANNVLMARQQLQMQQKQVADMQKAMQDAEYKAFMLKQLEEMAKQAEMIDGLLRELSKEDTVVVANKLQDPEPLTRWVAVQVAGKKRLPLEHDLIRVLADPHPLVRQAAQQALYRISRGTDFGPPPNATAKQLAATQNAWRDWLGVQTDARLSESSAR
jgi:hypothetical protein